MVNYYLVAEYIRGKGQVMSAKLRTALYAGLLTAASALWSVAGWAADPSPPADPKEGRPPKLISLPHHAGLTQPLVKGWHTFPHQAGPNWHALPIERKLGGGAPPGGAAPLALYSLGTTSFSLKPQSAGSSPINTSSSATLAGYNYKGETTIAFAPGSDLLVGGFNELASIGCGGPVPCAPGATVASISGNPAPATWKTSVLPLNVGTTTCLNLGFFLSCNILGYDPTLAVSSDNKTFFYSYGVCGADLDQCASASVMFATSTDGQNWTNSEVTSTVGNLFLFFDDKQSGTADPINPPRAYVVWTRNAMVLDTTTNITYAVQVIYLAQTNDGGTTWSSPANQYTTLVTPNAVSNPNDLQGAVIFAMPAVSNDGSKVYVVWIDYSQTPTRLFFNTCTPSGDPSNPIPTCNSTDPMTSGDPIIQGYGHPILSLNTPIQTDIACNSGRAITSTPSIAAVMTKLGTGALHERLYVTFADVPFGVGANTYNIFLIYSDDGGTSWNGPYRLNDDTTWQSRQHYFPALSVVHSTGDAYVSWLDRRNDSTDCLTQTFSTYTDGSLIVGALKVAPNLNVSAGPGRLPSSTANRSNYNGDVNGNGPGDYMGVVGLVLGKNLQYPLWPRHNSAKAAVFNIFTEEVTGP